MRLLLPVFFPATLLLGCTPPEVVKEDPLADPAGDVDEDGLTNGEESDIGSDPELADSDADGFADKEEVDGGYSPIWEFSHPFEEGDYLIGNCPVHPDQDIAGPTGTGEYDTMSWDAYQEGDVLANLINYDAFDQEVSVYSFCGNYTLVTQSAEWCGPCQDLASVMQDDQTEIRESYPNFGYYELLYQDNYGAVPDASVLRSWKRAFGLDGIPIVAPEDNTSEEMSWINASGGIPATLLLAPDMTVIWSGINHPREYYLYDVNGVITAIEEYEASLE